MKIPFYRPNLPPYALVEPEIRRMYESGMLYPGKYTQRLEQKVAAFTGVSNVQAVSSCSMGLVLVMNLLPPRSEVIIPSFTFKSTLQALEWCGHTPVVVDVDDNGQMYPELAADALEEYPDAAAVLPVHMWGNACYPVEFEELCLEEGPFLFFDGAHALGTTYKGKHLAHFGNGTVYSIAVTKPVSAGEGGLVVTRDLWVYEQVRDGAAHGLAGSLDTRMRGMNGKIQEFNSILAFHALETITDTRQRRAEIMNQYRKGLEGLPIRMWKEQEGVEACHKDCVIFTETRLERNRLEAYLGQQGIGTKRYFDPAVPDMGSFRGVIHSAENGRKLADTCLAIPLYPTLKYEEVEFVISTIRNYFSK